MRYFKQKIITSTELSGNQYVLFAIFCIATYLFPMFLWFPGDAPYYATTVNLRVISGILCIILVFNESWPTRFKKHLPWIWYFTLFYSLTFLSVMMFLLNADIKFWLLSVGLSSFLLASIVNWEIFLVMLVLGTLTAVFACLFIDSSLISSFSTLSYLFYATLFSAVVGIIFSRKRQEENQEKINSLRALSAVIAHEMRTPLVAISVASQNFDRYMSLLIHGYEEKGDNKIPPNVFEYLKTAPEQLYSMSRRNLVFIDILLKKFKGVDGLQELTVCSISDCIEKSIQQFPFEGSTADLVNIKNIKNFSFLGDETLTIHLLFNLISNSISHIQKTGVGQITIWTSDDEENSLYFQDNAGGIPPHVLPTIFLPFTSYEKNSGTGIGLAFCREVMRCFGGSITCRSDGKEITEFKLVFPS